MTTTSVDADDDEHDRLVEVGRRFICDGLAGTVRFIGQVPPTQGLWLGVEWDDPTRGKHDGTHNGQRYFETRHSTSGSFLRPKRADFGRSCLAAIRSRYCHQTAGDNFAADIPGHDPADDLQIIQRNNLVLSVEAVGYAKTSSKQSKLDQLKIVVLIDARVSHAGPMGELLNAVPSVVELNLTRNLFTSWSDVADICGQMPLLEALFVGSNQLQIPESLSLSLSESFANVRVLIMNRMGYNWNQVLVVCSTMFHRLEELSVAFNDIDHLDTPINDVFQSLIALDLEGNRICSWKEVNKLGALTRLEMLNLKATRLTSVSDLDTNLFPSLERLILHDNLISDWRDINELDRLPSLVDLQISNNPVTESDVDMVVGRQMFIARIGRLKLLNRSAISPAERRGAELDYLRKYGRDWLLAARQSSETDFLIDHPRFRHLIEVHGAADESEIDVRSPALKNSLISLQIRCPQMERPVTRKLPGTMNVQLLRNMVHRLTKIEDPVLYCESCKKPGHETEMDNDMRQLSFYAEDGDTIWIR